MEFSAPGAVHGALVGAAVLAVSMMAVGRSPGAPRGLALFGLAFALHVVRHLVALAAEPLGMVVSTILAETVHAGVGVLVLAATVIEMRAAPPRRTLLALWGGMAVALAILAPLHGAATASVAVTLFVAAVLLAAAAAFHFRAARAPGAGYRLVAGLFALWGLSRLLAPVLPVDSVLAQLLPEGVVICLGVALLLASDRERRMAEMASRRRAESLLRLQGEAIEAAANAIFITDRAGRIEWCNAAFTRLSGWSAAEARHRPARRLLAGRERDRRLMDAVAQGRPWHGELSLRRKDGTLYIVDQTLTPIADDKGRVAHYVVVQEDVTDRRQAEERIRFLSNHDALTALPNRLLFREHLQRAVARARAERVGLGVLFLDLDDFSHYNDVLGHDGGDRLLLLVVERLMATGRGVDTIARVGGDEFAVVLEDHTGGEVAAGMAQAMLEAVIRPFDFNGHEVQIGASVGIALYPMDGDDAEALMKNADVAMYRAIHEAPNGYRFFTPTMDSELAERRRLEGDLRRAAMRGELVLHYQPIVAVADHSIAGFEALVRWNHPEHGMIPPGRFIPLAEENGMIAPIGEWVLGEACRQARAWADEGLPAVPIAVNLSAVQMKRHDLPMLVRRLLTEARLPPGRLELELTETAMMEDAVAASRVLSDVTAMGLGLAVDDFGTGYSSLGRLKRFPVCKLKIDRSFVADVAENDSDRAIARAIISLAHALDLKVVAEGVETEAQLAVLEAEQCDCVQGFLFSPGVPAEQAAALLRKGGFRSSP